MNPVILTGEIMIKRYNEMSSTSEWIAKDPERLKQAIEYFNRMNKQYLDAVKAVGDIATAWAEMKCDHRWEYLDNFPITESEEIEASEPDEEVTQPKELPIVNTTWHEYSKCSRCGEIKGEEVIIDHNGIEISRKEITL